MEAAGGTSPDARSATPSPDHVLVVANETVGGDMLLDAIKRHAARGPVRCTVICPQNRPRNGLLVHDETVRSAAQIRLDHTLDRLRALGIEADGEVMDPDPFLAVQDAVRLYHPDEIIISTHPYPRSGWLRRDLVERIQSSTKLPVEHVVVDLKSEPITHTLVVANETVSERPLIEALEKRAAQSPHRFTIISPQGGKSPEAAATAKQRLEQTLDELRQAGLEVSGQIMESDPLTSVQNALQYHPANEIIISTFVGTRSRWQRMDLVDRVRRATGRRVEHIAVDAAERDPQATAVT
jgi:hypothetical protein